MSIGGPMNLMVDIETLGRTCHAPVIEIAVTGFNDMDVVETFAQFVYPDFAKSNPDASTIAWWSRQEAAMPLHEESPSFPVVLKELNEWLNGRPIHAVWANSPSFDLVILDNLAAAYGLSMPWDFRQYRDLRTIGAVGKALAVPRPRPEKAHVARYDAEAQAEWVIAINKVLVEKGAGII